MTEKLFSGVYAAVLSPRLGSGALDVPALQALLQFLLLHGVRRFAVNGATGEFPLCTPTQLGEVLHIVHEVFPGAEVLCGVGGAGLAQVLELVRVAESCNVQGLLLPMPYFFPYRQDDLAAFCEAVASHTRLPVLLYNLPQFTSGLESQTVCDLAGRVPNIVGVKDSSGSLDILQALTQQHPSACRLVGNDSALAPALRARVCDGVVSGVACVLPEVVTALYGACPDSDAFAARLSDLQAFIVQLNRFPTPWGLKFAAEARGILQAHVAQPLSLQREREAAEFRQWCRATLQRKPADKPAA